MRKKVYVIGDSFCREHWIKPRIGEDLHFWVNDLEKLIPDYDVICDGEPSRDVQTIIDTWIRLLKHVTIKDTIIICLPWFRRTRLPLNESNYTKKNYNGFFLDTRFVGTPSFDNKREVLEFWDSKYDWKFFEDKLQYQEIINSTKANQLNTIEIVESLIEFSKIKTYVFTWDVMDIKSKYIEDKDQIKNEIGFWETHYDVYNETNGQHGCIGDFHWSHKMNKHFSDYMYNKLFKL